MKTPVDCLCRTEEVPPAGVGSCAARHPVEDALQEVFLPALFREGTSQIPGRAVTSLSVKQAGISLPDPTQTARSKWTTSFVITGHFVAAIHRTVEY